MNHSTLGRAEGAKDDDTASVSDMSTGGSPPSPAESTDSPPGAQELPRQAVHAQLSRSSSPIPRTGSSLGDHTASPVSFGYLYHQSMNKGLFDTHCAAAIHS